MKTILASKRTLSLFSLWLCFCTSSKADFIPIPLTPESFNQDVIVEKSAPPPVVPVTTASMDAGIDNTGYAWFERGYMVDWLSLGLPAADSTITIGFGMDHDCRFAPTFKTNNVLLIDAALTNGTLSLVAPARCVRLSFLVSGGNGGGAVGLRIRHEDGSTETGTLNYQDWLDAMFAAFTTGGRVNVNTFNYLDLNQNRPGLFLKDVDLANTTSPVTSVEFAYQGGDSHNAIFAISGAEMAGAPFVALQVTGYNADIVVEATATRKGILRGVTTATPENGTGNWGSVWYEQGYYPPVPSSGLPPAGGSVILPGAPDHTYLMPTNYTDFNAIVLDADCTSAMITPVSSPKCGALSFLGAAGNGPVTVGCRVHHADGNAETNWFVLPDWLSATPAALTVTGRVSIDFRTVDLLKASGLFAAEIALTNVNSPVTRVVLTHAGGSATSRVVLFAMSGSAGGAGPGAPVVSIMAWSGGAFKIRTSVSGGLQSTAALRGEATVWRDDGAIAFELILQPQAGEEARFYRVVVP